MSKHQEHARLARNEGPVSQMEHDVLTNKDHNERFCTLSNDAVHPRHLFHVILIIPRNFSNLVSVTEQQVAQAGKPLLSLQNYRIFEKFLVGWINHNIPGGILDSRAD
jgi:hypothetical protein